MPIKTGNDNNSNEIPGKEAESKQEILKKSIGHKELVIQKQRKLTEELRIAKEKEIGILKSSFKEAEINEMNVLAEISEIDERRKLLVKKSNENYEKMNGINTRSEEVEEHFSNSLKDSKILITKLEGEIDTFQSQLKSLDEECKQPYLESINLKISAKEVELECPVCLETASAPIYMCLEQHLLCSSCRPKISTCHDCREPYTEGRSGAQSETSGAQAGA